MSVGVGTSLDDHFRPLSTGQERVGFGESAEQMPVEIRPMAACHRLDIDPTVHATANSRLSPTRLDPAWRWGLLRRSHEKCDAGNSSRDVERSS
eukprot:6192440-Pleurochrysis_carterae.AAC.3